MFKCEFTVCIYECACKRLCILWISMLQAVDTAFIQTYLHFSVKTGTNFVLGFFFSQSLIHE